MEQNQEVTETVISENTDLGSDQSQVAEHFDLYQRFGQRALVAGWRCGGTLCEARKKTKRGEWGKLLKSVGISKSTADRFMELSRYYDDITELEEFVSLDQALREGRSKRKKQDKDPGQLSLGFKPTQGILEPPDKLRGTEDGPADGEKEAAELRQENTRLRQEKTDLLKKIERLKRLLEENGIPWEPTPDDQQKEYPPAA